MPDVIGRLWATANAMDTNYTERFDEPLIINASEIDHVAKYCAKLKSSTLPQKHYSQAMLTGNAMIFGKRIKVLHE